MRAGRQDVKGKYELILFEHRAAGGDHTVIWTEGGELSLLVRGHLDDSQVRSVVKIYNQGYEKGKLDQAAKVKRHMGALLSGEISDD